MKTIKQNSKRWMWAASAVIVVMAAIVLGGCQDKKKAGAYKIGINQFMQHPLLDQTAKGLNDELAAAGISADKGSVMSVKNANGDESVAVQINKQFADDKVDVIVALGTPSAQSAVKTTQTIPVVFGAITDPVKAGIAASLANPGGNKTGTSDRWPFEQQVALIKKIVPKAVKVGIILNPAESNTEASMSYIRPALQKEGLTAIEVPIANTSEVFGAAKSLVGRCDVFLVPGDNTLISAFDTLVKVAREAKKPIIGGSDDLVQKGSLATYAGDYYQVGRATGKIVAQILKEKKAPGTIPVAVAEKSKLVINEKAAAELGITLPADLVAESKK